MNIYKLHFTLSDINKALTYLCIKGFIMFVFNPLNLSCSLTSSSTKNLSSPGAFSRNEKIISPLVFCVSIEVSGSGWIR